MGLKDLIRGKRVYFDAMIFIYLIENYLPLKIQLMDIKDSLSLAETNIVTSHLTLCETLVVPFRNENTKLIAQYYNFICKSRIFELYETNLDTYIRASLFRSQYGLKTPDAIHVSTAVRANCEFFLTNDKFIKTPSSLRVINIKDM